MMGVSTATLRYYDKEGLLPDIKRVNGIRIFEDRDFQWLRVLNCLKNTNMPIKEIKRYVDLCKEGDNSISERYQIILDQKQRILDEMEQLKYYLKEIEFKEWYYQEAIKAGSEEAVKDAASKKADLELDMIPKTKKGGE